MRSLILAVLALASSAHAEDATIFDAQSRRIDPRSEIALSFLRAYGTPSQNQVVQHHWRPVELTDMRGLTMHRLTSKPGSSADKYKLLVDEQNERIYLLESVGDNARIYGPISYPRGV